MTKHYRTKGFVFKKEESGDADRIFSVFTEDFGRIEVFAKAIRKIASKLKGNIGVFHLSEIEFIQGENRKTLVDTVSLQNAKNISEVPEKIEIAYKISNLLDIFIKGQEPDRKIWNLILDFFGKLDNYSSFVQMSKFSANTKALHYQLIYYYFFWNFISALGYKPELYNCSGCSQKLNPHDIYFSNKEGGVICKICFQKDKNAKEINSDVVKILRLFLKNDWQTTLKLKIQKYPQDLLKVISEDYNSYTMPIYSFKNHLTN